jgi:MFS family permease
MRRTPLFTRDFVLVSIANLFQGMSFFLFIHLPRFLADMGADEVMIGLLIGITALASIGIRPIVGRAMDTRGRRPVILAGGTVNLVVTLAYMTISTIGPWLYLVRVIHGVAEAAMFTSLFTYGADVVPESRRTEGLAIFGVSGLLPIALGGLVGDVILLNWGFDLLFFAAAAFGLAALLIALLLPERAPATADQPPRRGFFASVALPDLRPIWWIVGMFSFVLTAYFTFLRTFIDETGVGTVGLFFAMYAGTAIVLRLFLGWLPDRIGQRRVLLPALVILAFGFFVLAGASTATEVAIAGVLCGTGHGFAFPILFSMAVTRAPVADRGSVVAFFTALFDIGTLIAGPILGFIITQRGYSTMFVVCGVLLIGATAVYARWDSSYETAAQRRVAT